MASIPMLGVLSLAQKKVEEPEEEEDDSEDEAPLAAVAAAPSDEALRAEVLAILGTVKLEDFSLKDLLRRLGEFSRADCFAFFRLICIVPVMTSLYCCSWS